jgi:nicotinamidase-related amidase
MEESSPKYKSNEKKILSFAFEAHNIKGKINNYDRSVCIKITPDINLTSLTPTILISNLAEITPPSGMPQDFTDTINYLVVAQDESVVNYKVYTDVGNYILNPCLLIVHMQNYFINTLGIHKKDSVIYSISSIIESSRVENIPIIYSKSFPNGNREIIDEIMPLGNDMVIESNTDEAVIDSIKSMNIKNVVVVGILTHACVKDVCIELNRKGYNVILVEDATSVLLSQDIELIAETCRELEQNGVVELIKTNEIQF